MKTATVPSVELKGVTKAFPKGRVSIADIVRGAKDDGFHALSDISVAVYPGETLGILGSNGAGKSTLLQIMVGTLKPTHGSVEVRGRISALLELGAGFNPEWTGRRNSEFYCMIHGAEAQDLPDIIRGIEDFADIGEFFDRPMRTYSTGMFLRVAFAAAIAIDPEIIIVDEALAVGDARFQNKCFNKFRQLQQAGKTIILVTHDPVMVSQFCTRGIVLDRGRIIHDGTPDDAVSAHRKAMYGGEQPAAPPKRESAPLPVEDTERPGDDAPDEASAVLRGAFNWPPDGYELQRRAHFNSHGSSAGSTQGQIVDIQLLDENFRPTGPTITSRTRLKIATQIVASQNIRKPQYGLVIKSKENTLVFGVSNIMLKADTRPIRAGDGFVACFDVDVKLARGDYFIDIGFAETDAPELEVLEWRMSVCHFTVDNADEMYGVVDMDASFVRG